jgi:hypothetical protein
VVTIGAVSGIHMGHEIEYAVALHDGLARCYGNVVALFDSEQGIDFDMCVG